MKNISNLKYIYWFTYYKADYPCVRYRAKYPLEYLKEKYNINYVLITPGYSPVKILKFIMAYFSALFFKKENSLIFIQKVNSNFIYARLLKFLVKRNNKLTIYDMDDADYLVYPPKTINYFVEKCEAVTAGSHELVKKIKHFNSNIFLNTSPVPDFLIYKKSKNKLFTIGWIGGFGGDHKKSMYEHFFPSLLNIPIDIKLVMVGVNRIESTSIRHYFNSCNNIALEFPEINDWTDEYKIQNLISAFDVGIATLCDNEFHRSKSAFKLKQYFNNGVPVLSTDLPENNFFIDEGINGYFCNSPEKFREKILSIYYMTDEEYKNLSINARNSSKSFNLDNYTRNILSIFDKLSIKKELLQQIHFD